LAAALVIPGSDWAFGDTAFESWLFFSHIEVWGVIGAGPANFFAGIGGVWA